MRLQGLYCVVTGGASGIGAATVRRFAAEGAHICILDRDLSAAEALAAELGDSHLAMELDVRFEAGVEQVAEAVKASHRPGASNPAPRTSLEPSGVPGLYD